ncbi:MULTISPECIES: hypothetical protein [unclassified Simplicispira]|uniref:hypothetical protein n=1 Tax=unclassified Simplicispira TaxID=2630407 RepID=UPI000D5F06D0|nr:MULTISPECIES: hypothetical protein [unclassified Simplicispira]PVY56745.1 hypothetical protein C8D04_2009 [Simplicispira sp. 125]REG17689.1 hypothetical protein C8D01_2319 [Simplicispira sp. 110]
MNETHTYPDGSQRVGMPPFPKHSPLEEAAGKIAPAEVESVAQDVQDEPQPAKRGRKPKAEATE